MLREMPQISQIDIALRAFDKWTTRGYPADTHLQDWKEAETDLRQLQLLAQQLADLQQRLAESLAEQVQAPTSVRDMGEDPHLPRAGAAALSNLRGAIAFPIRNRVEVLGVLEFFSQEICVSTCEQERHVNGVTSRGSELMVRLPFTCT